MNKINSSFKKEAERLITLKGNVRGEMFIAVSLYIKKREGEGGVKAVEEKLKELGYPLKFKAFRSLRWYSNALLVLIILVAKEIFNWTDKDIFEMGGRVPQNSFLTPIVIKYFVSPEKFFGESFRYWQRYYDFGEVEPTELNKREKYLIIKIKGYEFHPVMCSFFAGFFQRIAQFVVESGKVAIEERKCLYKGGSDHEYLIQWQ